MRTMRALVLVLLVTACTRSSPSRTASSAAPASVSAPVTVPARPATSPLPVAVEPVRESVSEAAKIADDDLKTEEHEANPYSENVTLKLSVSPPAKAVVMWGARTVARLAPGSMDADIQRPRGSGPVDLEIRADGYLPYHTRLYTDRDEKTNVRLYRSEDAPGLFGYRRTINPSDKKR